MLKEAIKYGIKSRKYEIIWNRYVSDNLLEAKNLLVQARNSMPWMDFILFRYKVLENDKRSKKIT